MISYLAPNHTKAEALTFPSKAPPSFPYGSIKSVRRSRFAPGEYHNGTVCDTVFCGGTERRCFLLGPHTGFLACNLLVVTLFLRPTQKIGYKFSVDILDALDKGAKFHLRDISGGLGNQNLGHPKRAMVGGRAGQRHGTSSIERSFNACLFDSFPQNFCPVQVRRHGTRRLKPPWLSSHVGCAFGLPISVGSSFRVSHILHLHRHQHFF
ncbi:uncharacterized protein EV420DRAFT_434640 [Desarmillaria tabescens]|uniref:Uncharacterized protein n=1 Tax=Armillaria tabescens TaxID=1929756 RepID=A0AA39U063_ARMTA|nr:uncharacterized protein EV420DRAFT_434640 [Desarmillaria tabescens]KAK0467909.1 hypothetical protein EV420DRAFT_434640 [Desarmillaria tabescens]